MNKSIDLASTTGLERSDYVNKLQREIEGLKFSFMEAQDFPRMGEAFQMATAKLNTMAKVIEVQCGINDMQRTSMDYVHCKQMIDNLQFAMNHLREMTDEFARQATEPLDIMLDGTDTNGGEHKVSDIYVNICNQYQEGLRTWTPEQRLTIMMFLQRVVPHPESTD